MLVNLLRKAILTTTEFGLSILRLGLSHLTVIRTHKFFDHLLSSVEVIIKANDELVNQNIIVSEPLALAKG